MKKKVALLLLSLVLLCGCGKAPSQEAMADLTETTQVETTVETTVPPVVIYPGATEYFLGEVTDFSWEQEFPPEYVMLHFCSAVVNHPEDPYNHEYVRQTFLDAEVSVHYMVDREGNIFCYIPEDRSAWHAGYGTWLDDEKYTNKMNKYSIGIEIMAIGTYEEMSGYLHKKDYKKLPEEYIGYTDAQYAALKDLVADICQRHNIPLDREHVIGHEEFSPKKSDPGALFDWNRIIPATGPCPVSIETEGVRDGGLYFNILNENQKEIDSIALYTLWYDAAGCPVDIGGEIAPNATRESLPEVGSAKTANYMLPAEEGAAQAKQVIAAIYFANGTSWENQDIGIWLSTNLCTAG